MCVYSLSLLKKDETELLRGLIARYNNYDKMDILIEMCLQNPEEFFTRINEKVPLIPYVNVNSMDEALKYCDGGSCEITPLIKKGC